jgi:hypothetical protein
LHFYQSEKYLKENLMSHPLTLQIPEELYQPLIDAAAQMGQTPEEVALQWLSEAAQQIADDPIEQFIGTISSQIPDWTTQHDLYLGRQTSEINI